MLYPERNSNTTYPGSDQNLDQITGNLNTNLNTNLNNLNENSSNSNDLFKMIEFATDNNNVGNTWDNLSESNNSDFGFDTSMFDSVVVNDNTNEPSIDFGLDMFSKDLDLDKDNCKMVDPTLVQNIIPSQPTETIVYCATVELDQQQQQSSSNSNNNNTKSMSRDNSYSSILDSVVEMEQEQTPETAVFAVPDQCVPVKSNNANEFIENFVHSLEDEEKVTENNKDLSADAILASIEKNMPINLEISGVDCPPKAADMLTTIDMNDIPSTICEDSNEQNQNDEEVSNQDSDDSDYVPSNSGRSTRRSTRRKRKVSEFTEDFEELDDEEYEEESPKRRSAKASKPTNPNKKTKLYELPAFSDPVMEKKRQDAIHAKENRDRKKKEKNALEKQMQILRKENESIRRREQESKKRAEEACKSVEYLMAILQKNGMAGLVDKSKLSVLSSSPVASSSRKQRKWNHHKNIDNCSSKYSRSSKNRGNRYRVKPKFSFTLYLTNRYNIYVLLPCKYNMCSCYFNQIFIDFVIFITAKEGRYNIEIFKSTHHACFVLLLSLTLLVSKLEVVRNFNI